MIIDPDTNLHIGLAKHLEFSNTLEKRIEKLEERLEIAEITINKIEKGIYELV